MEYYFKCPKCKSNEEFKTIKERSDVGGLIFIFGGFIPALLYGDYTTRRIQCAHCGLIFRQPNFPRTSLSRLAVWNINLIVLFLIFIMFFIYVPELNVLIPDIKILGELEIFINSHSKLIAFFIPLMLVFIILFCMIASFLSNFKANQELKQKFRTKPESIKERGSR